MAFARRQFGLTVAQGDVDTLLEAMGTTPYYQSNDVNPRMVLRLEDGGYAGYQTQIAAAGSYTVQLPNTYTSASRLFFAMSTSQTAKVVVVSPDHSTSTVLVSAIGTSPGVFSWTGTVTSITVSVPGASASTFSYMAWTLPDISLSSGWRQGQQSSGIQDDE